MEDKQVSSSITEDELGELLQRLKIAETEKNKLARELKIVKKNIDTMRLNMESQTEMNEFISREKQKQELYVRLLLESCPDPMFIFDRDMKFLLGTKSTSSLIDIDDVSILQGRDIDNIVERYRPPVFMEGLTTLIKSLIFQRGGRAIETTLEILSIDRIYETNLLPFHKDTGEFSGVLVSLHDITDIMKSKEIAELASMAKGEFLSRMSHEMRTPMNAIIGMTNIAQRSSDPEKKEYCLNRIESASKHLLGVINDVLDMSKIEANKFDLVIDAFNFGKMLNNVLNVISYRAEEKQQNLFIDMDSSIPEIIIGDELRLSQVITNLLTNAVKFTPEGGSITLTTKKLPTLPGSQPAIQVEVADTGIGITREQQSRLFASFEQADGSIARKYGGTGLGLAISKRIIELMGGRIWIESEFGGGSKFIFTIKYEVGETKEQTRLNIKRDDIRILAVDDSFETREFLLDVMKSYSLPCDAAADGYEALEMIEKCGDKPYNIFFIDWQMPGMNGTELALKIKDVAKDNSVVIMMSVTEWSDIEKETTEVIGIDRFISKPLFPSKIVDNINECVDILQGDDNSTQDGNIKKVSDYKGRTILIAEDIEINREILDAILEDTGLSIDFAVNGRDAVAKYTERPGRYSLIFMDIQMPEMDGFEATRRIRSQKNEDAGTIPIVAMTANVFKEDIENCLAAGMNCHLGKPIDTKDLFEVLELYL